MSINLAIVGATGLVGQEILKKKYERDLAKDIKIEIPKNYFYADDPSKSPVVKWRGHSNLLFLNWLHHYVC